MNTADDRQVTLADLVTLTAFMAEDGYSPKDIAYAVEKPWKFVDVLDFAQAIAEHERSTDHTVLAELTTEQRLYRYCNDCEWTHSQERSS